MLRKKLDFDAFVRRLNEAFDAAKAKSPDLSQREVGRQAGVSSGQVSRWLRGERGKGIQADSLRGLAIALGVHENWLGWGEGPREVDEKAVTLEQRFLQRYPQLDDEQRAIVHAVYTRNPSTNVEQLAALIQADNLVKDLQKHPPRPLPPPAQKPERAPRSSRPERAPASRRKVEE